MALNSIYDEIGFGVSTKVRYHLVHGTDLLDRPRDYSRTLDRLTARNLLLSLPAKSQEIFRAAAAATCFNSVPHGPSCGRVGDDIVRESSAIRKPVARLRSVKGGCAWRP